jgi:hypothetical protein
VSDEEDPNNPKKIIIPYELLKVSPENEEIQQQLEIFVKKYKDVRFINICERYLDLLSHFILFYSIFLCS